MTAPVFTDGDPGPEIRRKLNELGVLFQEAIDGLFGPQGWSPVLAVVVDGERRVFEVVDWVGGQDTKPTELGYIGATGIVPDIADAVDIRGPVGATGAAGTKGDTGDTGPAGTNGTNGTDGDDGWTPIFALVADGARVVMQVVDWAGGTGTKPATGKYVGPTGLVTLIADGVDVRGPAGAGGGGSGDVVGPASATNNGVALFDGTTGKLIKDGGVLGTAAFSATSAFATAAQGTKADTAVQPGSLATVATSGAYADLSGKPTLGTASALDVPATGNAATGEVVKGNDTRLSDSRPPTGTAGGVLSGSYPNPGFAVDMATQAELDAVSSVANSKLSDAPSDGKTYGRKDGAWSEVVSGGATYRIGDVVIANTAPTTGTWFMNDSSIYLQSSYPALYSELGLIANAPGQVSSFTSRTMPSSGNWGVMGYGNGVFVATTNNGAPTAASSTDGMTWTARTFPSNQQWTGVAYGNGTFVAVGLSSSGTATTVAATSPDGATWTNRTIASSQWSSVAFGNGIFVAVSRTAGTTAATSPDGITWTARTLPTSAGWWAVTFGSGIFVAVASGGTAAAYSADGITWTAATLPSSGSWRSIAYGNGNFVALGLASAIALTSPDGITWTSRTLPSSSNWQAIAFGGGTFMAVTQTSGSTCAVSPDGIVWTTRTLPATGTYFGVAYGNKLFVTAASASTSAASAYAGVSYNPTTQFAVPRAISQDINSWVRAL